MTAGDWFSFSKELIKDAKRAKEDQQAARYIDWVAATFGPEYADVARKAWQQTRNFEAVDEAVEQLEERKRRKSAIDRMVEAPPTAHGSARWARVSELESNGLMVNGSEWGHFTDGIRFARLSVAEQDVAIDVERNFIVWHGEGHLLTCGTTRSGKATAQIVPNLMSYTGSVVVNDPKGELWELTAGHRYANGSAVYRIAPFDDDTDSLNPLDLVETEEDARLLAKALVPERSTGDGGFFEREAANFLTAVILERALYERNPDYRTIGYIRDLIFGDPTELEAYVASLRDIPNATIRNQAVNFIGRGGKAIGDLKRSLDEPMAIWDNPGLRRATARTDFEIDRLKADCISVYLGIPLTGAEAYGRFVGSFFTLLIARMTRTRLAGTPPVLFLLDEFANLGAQPELVKLLSFGAGHNMRVWLFVQDFLQLRQLYGDAWETILGQTEVKSFLRVLDPFTLNKIVEYMGQTTVAYRSPNWSSTIGGGYGTSEHGESGGLNDGFTYNEGVQLTGRPLVTPDELRELLSAKWSDIDHGLHQLLLIDGLRPFACARMPYFMMGQTAAWLRQAADELDEMRRNSRR